jgi:hypothetical protein
MEIFLDIITNKTVEVLFALLPLLIIFIIFQFVKIKLPRAQFVIVLRGLFLTFAGLVLFLSGVDLGFIYMGDLIGKTLGQLSYNWILIPIGFVLGFVVTIAEPAIQVLIIEVEKVTAGSINRKIILYFLSFGVAVAVALSMFRMMNNISLWYFILPGYLIVLIFMWFVSPVFVSIAFDSGGVVTGPMIATFLLSLFVGSSTVISGSDPLTDAFGMIAMVAMVPILSILILGFLYNRAEAKMEKEIRNIKEKEEKKTGVISDFELIVVITNKEHVKHIVDVTKKADVKKEVINFENYVGLSEERKMSDIPTEPQKEMILVLVESGKSKKVLKKIQKEMYFNNIDNSVAFILDSKNIDDICNMYNAMKEKR